ncbi:MAG: methionine biosynthesis protein MetW [Proteobacteria bacterium]|nr:methionine biosynthesis protein MetW [Pseudomonadota bacterium]MBU1738010.1 methionine biosynthesis protein MetW [Pseudomonadota bacterium]
MRYDLQIIASWVEPGSKVLDLGCGSGELLQYLEETKNITGTGIEGSEELATRAIDKGLQVLQGDINEEVLDYQDDYFDYVVLSQTLQQVFEPHVLIRELLRIGRFVIVSFPNFSHWSIRLQLLFNGYAPKNSQLPYEWYDTPNIRVITIEDFRKFARRSPGCRIIKEAAINTESHGRKGKIITFLPNLRATYGIFLISRK